MAGGAVRFCTRCGRPVTEGARFCTGCGNPLAQPGRYDPGTADTGQQSPPDDAPTVAGIPPDTTLPASGTTLPAFGRVPPAPTSRDAGEAGTSGLAGMRRPWPTKDQDPPTPPPVHAVDQPPPGQPPWTSLPPERGTVRGPRLALIAVCTVVVVAAATAGGIVLAHRHGAAPSRAQSGGTAASSHAGPASAGNPSPTPAPTTPAPSPSPTQPLAATRSASAPRWPATRSRRPSYRFSRHISPRSIHVITTHT